MRRLSLCQYLPSCVFLHESADDNATFVRFLLLNKSVFFRLCSFFITAIVINETLYLADLIGMHSAVVWAFTKISFSPFGVWLSNVSWRISNLFLTVISIFIVYITCCKSGPVLTSGFLWLFLISSQALLYLCRDNSVIGWCSFKREVCFSVSKGIRPLLVHEYIEFLYFSFILVGVGS